MLFSHLKIVWTVSSAVTANLYISPLTFRKNTALASHWSDLGNCIGRKLFIGTNLIVSPNPRPIWDGPVPIRDGLERSNTNIV